MADLGDCAMEIIKGVDNMMPGIAILTATISAIYRTCENVKRQRHQCRQLADFCQDVVLCLERNATGVDDKIMAQAVGRMQIVLEDVQHSMQKWSELRFWDSWTKQDRIRSSIQDKRVALADCFAIFDISSQLRLHAWNEKFSAAAEQDRQMLMQLTESSRRTEEHITEIRREKEVLKRSGSLMQTNNAEDAMRTIQLRMRMEQQGSDQHKALQQTLLDLTKSTNQLVPLADLDGEAQKIGQKAVHYSAAYEIWKGIWLGNNDEVVALKCMRAPTPNEKAIRRFHRQVENVRKLRHKHVIPFYGACYVDGPSVYLVFPWMRNGDILKYVETNPHVDRMRLMLGVARGIQYLHSQRFVHGGLQPSNILISNDGDAVLSDFGLAKALEGLDSTYTNYTLSNGSQMSLRWMAPELTDGKMGLPADVYAWSMTSLHVLTGLMPFYQTKQPGRVVINVAGGLRPRREDYDADRALADAMWRLFEECWRQEPETRPQIDSVIQRVFAMRPDLQGRI